MLRTRLNRIIYLRLLHILMEYFDFLEWPLSQDQQDDEDLVLNTKITNGSLIWSWIPNGALHDIANKLPQSRAVIRDMLCEGAARFILKTDPAWVCSGFNAKDWREMMKMTDSFCYPECRPFASSLSMLFTYADSQWSDLVVRFLNVTEEYLLEEFSPYRQAVLNKVAEIELAHFTVEEGSRKFEEYFRKYGKK